MPPTRTRESLSSSQELDLWEHACLLYHSYEWQEAADAFAPLAQMASDDSKSMRYHVNAGLILARLGDLPDARVAFLLASKKNNRCPLTHFLLGLVAVEMEDLLPALASFELCALRMGDEGVISYHTEGLKFRLHEQLVADNISKVRTIVDGQAALPGVKLLPPSLDGIPADLLFEAPARGASDRRSTMGSSLFSTTRKTPIRASSSTGQSRRSFASIYTRGSKLTRLTTVNIKKSGANNSPPGSVRESELVDDRTIRIGSSHSSSADSFHPSLLPAPLAPRMVPRTTTPPKSNHAPREVAFDYKSTRELARFIRYTGPSTGGTKNFDVDRDYMLHLLKDTGVNTGSATPSTLEEVAEKPPLRRRASDMYGSVLDYYITAAEIRRKSLPDLARMESQSNERTAARSPFIEPRSAPTPPSQLPSPAPGRGAKAEHIASVLQRRLSNTPTPSLVSSAGIFRMGLKDARARGWHL
nr:hypothetical protein B0A51_15951 [Rachicladosporium sp. CCFEE 5018]